MFETHVNYLAVLSATALSWIAGAIYYTTIAKAWMAALEMTKEEILARSPKPPVLLHLVSLAGELVMAYLLARFFAALGFAGVAQGVLLGVLAWIAFVVPSVAVNNAYPGRKAFLTVLDSLHWLIVLAIQGAVIGAFN